MYVCVCVCVYIYIYRERERERQREREYMFAEVFFNNKRYTALFNNLYKVILWQSDTFRISADYVYTVHSYMCI